MTELKLDKKIHEHELLITGNKKIKLSNYRGKTVVLYFYPKASTPGCTRESLDFSKAINKFRRQSTVVLGVSRDSLKAQENFKAKQGLTFELIADQDETLCNAFDVIKMKNMYGKKVRGIERSTFLLDSEGVVCKTWRKVKVDGHAEEVLEAVKALKKS